MQEDLPFNSADGKLEDGAVDRFHDSHVHQGISHVERGFGQANRSVLRDLGQDVIMNLLNR
jgi:hypothetical protein